MRGTWKEKGRGLFAPLVRGLVRLGVSPSQITVAGLLLALAAGSAAGLGRLRLAGISLILSALCDLLDGQVARMSGREGPAGAFLDSCFDRVAEAAVYLGLIVYFRDSPALVLTAGAALVSSYMVSYARARAEGLGFTCAVGLMERPERLAVLIVALLVGGRTLWIGLALLALLSTVTFVQRFLHVMRSAAECQRRATPPH